MKVPDNSILKIITLEINWKCLGEAIISCNWKEMKDLNMRD